MALGHNGIHLSQKKNVKALWKDSFYMNRKPWHFSTQLENSAFHNDENNAETWSCHSYTKTYSRAPTAY